MNKKATIMMAAAISAIGLGSGAVVQRAFAHDGGTPDTLINKLATKFNLDKTEVQKVFEEDRAEKVAALEEKVTDRLEQAVLDGDITATQKDLIIAKQAEVKTRMEEIKNMEDAATKKAAIQKLREEMRTWAEANGITLKNLLPLSMKMHGPGHGRGEIEKMK